MDGTTERANGRVKVEHKNWSPPTALSLDVLKPQVVSPTLTEAEQAELSRCEDTIRRGWQSFVEVGEALTKIYEQKLYRDRDERFEDYYQTEWQYQKSQIYRLIGAAKLVRILSPIGENGLLPSNESQVRPLLGLEDADAQAVWSLVSREVNGNAQRITARLVQKQVRAVVPRDKETTRGSDALRTRNRDGRFTEIKKALNSLVALVGDENRRKAKQLQGEIIALAKKLVR